MPELPQAVEAHLNSPRMRQDERADLSFIPVPRSCAATSATPAQLAAGNWATWT